MKPMDAVFHPAEARSQDFYDTHTGIFFWWRRFLLFAFLFCEALGGGLLFFPVPHPALY
jgi:hypothetical protein